MAGSGNERRHHIPIDRDENLLVDPDAEVILPKDDLHRLRDEIDILLVIAFGGFVGTLCRYELTLHWIQADTSFPLAIFTINVSGSFVIGLLLTFIIENMRPTRYLRPLTCVGFLGGWTTMSTLALGGDHLISSNHVGTAVVYLVLSTIVSPFVAGLGIHLAHLLPHRHESHAELVK